MYTISRIKVAIIASFFAINMIAQQDVKASEHWPQPDAKALAEWQELGFGMFIHWGPVSLTGHEIGWSRGKKTPIEVYDNLYKRFNPTRFDANAWVKTAKDAGMTYLVITAKHHDGFCLWPSEATDYDIAETPFGRDVIAELSEACKKHDIKFGIYYSICDWYHPSFPRGGRSGGTEKPNHDINAYDRYVRTQTQELLRNYGPLVTMWFDIPQVYTYKHGIGMVKKLREIQPDIIINNRAYSGAPCGDYDTPEQHIGEFNRERPWETCMTICRQWSWKPHDSMKSLKQCLHTLIYTVGGDGNLLFNVGPTPEGEIEERQVERLKEMGEWLNEYGKCIYKTRGGPFKPGEWGASTCRGNSIYLFVINWNRTQITLPPLGVKVKKATALSGGKVEMKQSARGITLSLPVDDQQYIATVIELKIDGDALELNPVEVVNRSYSLAFQKDTKASNVFENQIEKYGPQMALDDQPETRWATDEGIQQAVMDIDLGKVKEISSVQIDERSWNRVKKFALQHKQGDKWETIFTGSEIGENFKKVFPPVKAQHVRFNILEAADGPTIYEFHLFGPESE